MDNYKQNKEIKKESDFYFSCCNKVLDYLYKIKDSIPADNNIILDFENIRKKIGLKAPLEDSEISLLTAGMGFVVNSVEANISDLTALVTGLKERIKILTSLED